MSTNGHILNVEELLSPRAPSDIKPIWRGWGANNTAPFFCFRFIDEDEANAIRARSLDEQMPTVRVKERGFRTKSVDNVDGARLMDNMVEASLQGWKEFHVRHLMELVPPTTAVRVTGGAGDAPVEFNDANRRWLATKSIVAFRAWAFEQITDIGAFHAAQEAEASGNL